MTTRSINPLAAALLALPLMLGTPVFASEVTGTLSGGSSAQTDGSISGTVTGGSSGGGSTAGSGGGLGGRPAGGGGGSAPAPAVSGTFSGPATVLAAPISPTFAVEGSTAGALRWPATGPAAQSAPAPESGLAALGPMTDSYLDLPPDLTNDTLAAQAGGAGVGARIAWILFFAAVLAYILYAAYRAYRRNDGRY